MAKQITRSIPARVDEYYKSLARKYFYTVNFIIAETATALQQGLQIDEHLANEETRQRAVKTGSYEPYPFEFNGIEMSHSRMTTLLLCYRVINKQEFVGSVHAFWNALPYKTKGATNFGKHIEKFLDIGWLEVEYIIADPTRAITRNNIQGRYTMPAIADDIVNHVVKTGYRL